MQTESLTLRSRDPLITGRYPVVLCISVQSRIARKVEMERLLISFAAMLFGATIGYIAVWFLSEMFLPDSKGPATYGDWRSVGNGLFLGVPIGALSGIVAALVFTRRLSATEQIRYRWPPYACAGGILGIGSALLIYKNPLLELFEGLGSLVGDISIGTLLYYLFCGAAGASILTVIGLIVNRFQK